jgi:DNA-binding HxlR family transcriptional regulator
MSRLLRRLEGAGLIENRGEGHTRGEPNAWWLTQRGKAIHTALAGTEKVGDGRSAQAASLTGSNASTSASTS